MHTKPKNILGKNLIWMISGLLTFTIACKSTQELPPKEAVSNLEPIAQIESDDSNSDDSLMAMQLLRQKEAAIANYRAAATREFDILDTELDLHFDYEQQAVMGEAILTITPYAKAQSILVLDAKDFEPGSIYFSDDGEETSTNYRYDYKQSL